VNADDRIEQLRSVVAGAERAGERTYEVRSPATGAPLAAVQCAAPADVDAAVAAARTSFDTVRWQPLRERVALCHRVADLLEQHAEPLGRELSEEHGKPLAEARGELAASVVNMRVFAEEVRRLDGWSPGVDDPAKRVLVLRQARGVWAFLTPWNFPLMVPLEYIGPALATGSPFVWKPAPTTARIAHRLHALLLEAGAEPGAVNLLLTDAVEEAQQLVAHEGVDCVGLTGGSRTGAAVARAAWDKHLLLELGGNGPVVVLDDADVDLAAAAIANAAFLNAGQVCSAAGRVLVAEEIADALAERLATAADEIVLGDPLADGTTMGPVHVASVADTMARHVADAVERGADLLSGGERLAGRPTDHFFRPTVLDRVPSDSQVLAEETFGPIAPLTRVASPEALLAQANGGPFGLVAALFTSSLDRAFHWGERLEAGSVVVNDTSNYWEPHLPFGGWAGTRSGRGRVGGRAALAEFTQSKTLSLHVGGR
jgi:acyl-CoA reductase-like NAD-dependent aldehyde dehydrogenase